MLKPKIKKMNGFIEFITGGWVVGITLAPFGIYVKEKHLTNKRIINHEKIHWAQQMEMFVAGLIIAIIVVGIFLIQKIFSLWLLTSIIFPFLFFYLWYVIEWFIRLFINGSKAYVSLSHEREANAFENDYEYLKKRRYFTWLKYIIKSN